MATSTMGTMFDRFDRFTSSMRNRRGRNTKQLQIGKPTLMSTTNTNLLNEGSNLKDVELKVETLGREYRDFNSFDNHHQHSPPNKSSSKQQNYNTWSPTKTTTNMSPYHVVNRPDTPESAPPSPPPKDTEPTMEYESYNEERWTTTTTRSPPRIPSLALNSPIKFNSSNNFTLSSSTTSSSFQQTSNHQTSQSLGDSTMFNRTTSPTPNDMRRQTFQTPQNQRGGGGSYITPPSSASHYYGNETPKQREERLLHERHQLRHYTPTNNDGLPITPPISPLETREELMRLIEKTPGTVGYNIIGAFNNVTKETIALQPGYEHAWKIYNPHGPRKEMKKLAPHVDEPAPPTANQKARHIPLDTHFNNKQQKQQKSPIDEPNPPSFGVFVPTSSANQSVFPYTPSPREKNILPPPVFPIQRNGSPVGRTPSPRFMNGPNPLSRTTSPPVSPTSEMQSRAPYKPYHPPPSQIPVRIPSGPRPIPPSHNSPHNFSSSRLPHFILEDNPAPINEPHPSESAERLEQHPTPTSATFNPTPPPQQTYNSPQSIQKAQDQPPVQHSYKRPGPPAPQQSTISSPEPLITPITTTTNYKSTAYIAPVPSTRIHYSAPLKIDTLDPTRGAGTNGIAGPTGHHRPVPTPIYDKLAPKLGLPPTPTPLPLPTPISKPKPTLAPTQEGEGEEDLISKLQHHSDALHAERATLRAKIYKLKQIIPAVKTETNKHTREAQVQELEEMEREEADLGVEIYKVGCRIHRALRRRERRGEEGRGGFWINRCQD